MDRDVVNKIEAILGRRPSAEFDGDTCIALDLTAPDYHYEGLARRSDVKQLILSEIAKLRYLRYLNLRKNRFGPLLLNFPFPPTLRRLEISSNYIGGLPDTVAGLPLEYLGAAVNGITQVPSWVWDMSELETLRLHKNQIAYLDPRLGKLKRLRHLNLYAINVDEVPEWLFDLPQVESFAWGITRSRRLPAAIGRWQRLTYLTLVANQISELPEELCDCRQLRGMKLMKNGLERLPERIGNLERLEDLSLYFNELTVLPESFNRLRLRRLNLARNRLATIPDIPGLIWYEHD